MYDINNTQSKQTACETNSYDSVLKQSQTTENLFLVMWKKLQSVPKHIPYILAYKSQN